MNLQNGKRLVIIIGSLIACLLIVLISLLVYIIATRPSTSNITSTPSQDSLDNTVEQIVSSTVFQPEVPQIEQIETKKFEGKFVATVTPVDWSVKEYSDESGTKESTDSDNISFSGLTGVDILNESNQLIFSFKGFYSGRGGTSGCSEVAQFSDTEASYIEMINYETTAYFENATPTEVIDLTNADYSDIFTFGVRFRRVGNNLYFAKEENPNTFNTACGVSAQFVELNDVNFTVMDGEYIYESNVYDYEINSAITDSNTLEKLDEVLNSLKKV